MGLIYALVVIHDVEHFRVFCLCLDMCSIMSYVLHVVIHVVEHCPLFGQCSRKDGEQSLVIEDDDSWICPMFI